MYSTSLCYLEGGRKWFMLYHATKKNDINEGEYIGAGGKSLEGGSSEECAAREIFEETGYILTYYRYADIMTSVSDRYEAEHIHLFLADGPAGEYHDTEEGISSWVSKEEALKLPFWGDDRIFLPLLQRNISLFLLKLYYKGDALTAVKLNGGPLFLRTRQKEIEAGEVSV